MKYVNYEQKNKKTCTGYNDDLGNYIFESHLLSHRVKRRGNLIMNWEWKKIPELGTVGSYLYYGLLYANMMASIILIGILVSKIISP